MASGEERSMPEFLKKLVQNLFGGFVLIQKEDLKDYYLHLCITFWVK